MPTMLTGPTNSGANGANRALIGCLPCNCSPVELHRLGARGGIRNPDLRVTNAVLLHLSYSGARKEWSECGESNSVDRTGDPMPSQWATPAESLERTEIIEISSLGWRPRAYPIYHARSTITTSSLFSFQRTAQGTLIVRRFLFEVT